MIVRLQKNEVNRISEIWLDTNIKAHNFIDRTYWKDNYEIVKKLFLEAEIYVYKDDADIIEGFVGLRNDYIARIFVCEQAQSKGIGKELLDFAKKVRARLYLHVYQKNVRAVKFYQREDFSIQSQGMDEETGQKEYCMIWKRADNFNLDGGYR